MSRYYLIIIVIIVFLCTYYFNVIIVICSGSLFNVDYSITAPGAKYPPTKGEVWPKPQYEVRQALYYTLDPARFKIKVTNETCKILTNAIERYINIVTRIGQVSKRNTRRKNVETVDYDENQENHEGLLEVLQVDLTAPCEEYPHFDMDESYELSVSSNSTLRSECVWGIMRGLETFSQLFYFSRSHNATLIHLTQINDAPRYKHRGLLLDTSRHFISVTNIVKTLDAMAINKMNVFHWHIVDDQSFPYQSEKFPEISEQGAYDPSMVYTREDIKNIVEYARHRGIRVVPEFDVPGHTRSWGNAYPNILVECYKKNKIVGLGPLDPINNNTYKLLRDLFQEVQNWFPDKYFHIGGDEVLLNCWKSNPQLQVYMKNHNIDVKGLHALFMRKAIPLLTNGSKVIVWQEVFDNGVSLDKDTLIQVWKYFWLEEMIKVLTKGHKVLFSSSWYLDYLNDNWEELYAVDPRQMIIDITSDETLATGIVGGEACMWGEMVDDRNVISRVWPRTSAVAERLWSFNIGRTPASSTYHRLEEHTCRMIRRDIAAEPPSGSGFCVD